MDYDLKLVGTVGGWNFDAEYVDYILSKKKGCRVECMIDSLGGYTNHGLSISAAFRNHGDVHVTFRGMNASAATIAALGAKHVAMEQDALYLIHKCSVMVLEWAYMNEEELASEIAKLEHERQNAMKIDVAVAQAYARKTCKTKDEMLELMSKELWLTAEEALEYGFVDEIVKTQEQDKNAMVITSSLENEFKQAGLPIPSMLKREEEGLFQRMIKFFTKMDTNNNQQPNAAQQTSAPSLEDMQKNISELTTKVTSLEGTNKTLSEENDNLKKEIEEMKSKVTEAPKNVLTNEGHNGEEEQEDDFISALAKAQELSKLV